MLAMVCVAGEGSVVCVIRDCRGAQPKSTHLVRPSTTVSDVFNHVARLYSYHPDSFELVLQSARGEVVELNMMKGKTLMDVGLDFSSETKYTLVVTDIAGKPPKRTTITADSEDELVLGASASPTALYNSSNYNYTSAPVPPPQPPIEEFYSFSNKSIKPETTNRERQCELLRSATEQFGAISHSYAESLKMFAEASKMQADASMQCAAAISIGRSK